MDYIDYSLKDYATQMANHFDTAVKKILDERQSVLNEVKTEFKSYSDGVVAECKKNADLSRQFYHKILDTEENIYKSILVLSAVILSSRKELTAEEILDIVNGFNKKFS